jgi:hypothetical protein
MGVGVGVEILVVMASVEAEGLPGLLVAMGPAVRA